MLTINALCSTLNISVVKNAARIEREKKKRQYSKSKIRSYCLIVRCLYFCGMLVKLSNAFANNTSFSIEREIEWNERDHWNKGNAHTQSKYRKMNRCARFSCMSSHFRDYNFRSTIKWANGILRHAWEFCDFQMCKHSMWFIVYDARARRRQNKKAIIFRCFWCCCICMLCSFTFFGLFQSGFRNDKEIAHVHNIRCCALSRGSSILNARSRAHTHKHL